jgi:nucleoside-diphosphate-sugar epimerase
MRVFVTGATGLIGFSVVKELVAAGHQVRGLARSEGSEKKLVAVGAQALRGDVENLHVLRRGATWADGVIHTAFYHQISHIPLGTRLKVFLGGLPTRIVERFLRAALDADRRALETMGGALRDSGKPLIGTFGTLALQPGQLATEEQPVDSMSAGAQRGSTESVLHRLATQAVRASIVRLPPVVHGEGDRNGFMPFLIKAARKRKEAVYLEDGKNRWAAVHKIDAACLFRLVLENGSAGAAYHAVAEGGISFREIAQHLGSKLRVPVVSKPKEDAAKYFSFLAPFVNVDNPVSSKLTQKAMSWRPTHPGLFENLQSSGYYNA